ncbi:MAG: (2Fe-2S)-binding protein [Streptosporangiales bacterium]|nr:(2Fe-2S)-binding protein [Streptosporangiales bacterium]
MYVCICYAVTEREAVDVIEAGARTPEDVAGACGAGTGCGSCVKKICALIDRHVLPERQEEGFVLTRTS